MKTSPRITYEYFRNLLREAQQKEADARLEALLLEGLASESIPLNEEFWQRFKVKTEQIRRKYSRPASSAP